MNKRNQIALNQALQKGAFHTRAIPCRGCIDCFPDPSSIKTPAPPLKEWMGGEVSAETVLSECSLKVILNPNHSLGLSTLQGMGMQPQAALHSTGKPGARSITGSVGHSHSSGGTCQQLHTSYSVLPLDHPLLVETNRAESNPANIPGAGSRGKDPKP